MLVNGSVEYFDIVELIFRQNPYAYDGWFPYPSSPFPVVEYSIRKMNRKTDVVLLQNISFRFKTVEYPNNHRMQVLH
jgi:hypothetical protein